MGFEDFLPEKDVEIGINNSKVEKTKPEQIDQEQFYDMLTSKQVSWQAVIYELIQTEQLDP